MIFKECYSSNCFQLSYFSLYNFGICAKRYCIVRVYTSVVLNVLVGLMLKTTTTQSSCKIPNRIQQNFIYHTYRSYKEMKKVFIFFGFGTRRKTNELFFFSDLFLSFIFRFSYYVITYFIIIQR